MRKPLTTGIIVAGVLAIAMSCPAWAKKKARPRKAKSVRALVLPLKVRGLKADQARTLGKLAGTTVVKELKELGIFKLMVGKKVLVKDCHTKRKCIRAVGRRFKAKVIFQLLVAKDEDGLSVTVSTLDVRSGKEVRKEVQRTTGESDDVERAARWAARMVSSPMITTLLKGKGNLEIQASEDGADLYLNGKNFGKRTGKSFKVGSGVFDIQVKKEGFKPFHDVVVIKPGKRVVVKAELQSDRPAAVAVAPVPEDELPEPPPDDPTTKPEPKKDLPAWAIFEKPKPGGEPGKAQPGKTEPGKTEPGKTDTPKTVAATRPADKPKPFLPPKEDPLDEPVEKIDEQDSDWYATWWFWTIVGVAVAGGVGGGLYAGGVFDSGGGTTQTGAALVSWQ